MTETTRPRIYFPIDQLGKEEVDGIYLYGYSSELPRLNVGELVDEIPGWKSCDIVEMRSREGEGCIYLTSLWVRAWPSTAVWEQLICDSLELIVQRGALVSWAGDEYSTPNVQVLNPDKAYGYVTAAYCQATGYISAQSNKGAQFGELSDAQLGEIWMAIDVGDAMEE